MRLKFEKKITLLAVLMVFIPLFLSYLLSLGFKLESVQDEIKKDLKDVGTIISNTPTIQKNLSYKENSKDIQNYVMNIINDLKNIDIIVVADMDGKKYSHLDTNQIGKIFINEDKNNVLKYGRGYYSLMIGSMGKTIRWFQPIFYNNKQVGFVMTGKYYNDLAILNYEIIAYYFGLFVLVIGITIIVARYFGKSIKTSMLGMEPKEIARLYKEKSVVINSINEGIMVLNQNNEIVDINKCCYNMFYEFVPDKVIEKLNQHIKNKDSFEMKEFIILGKKIFITLKFILEEDSYLGAIITLINKEEINKVAKEITSIDQTVKNLRATVHEFKNKLHVILGLVKLEEYEEVKNYILKIQQAQENNILKFSNIEDYYVKGMLISKELMANERKINFIILEDSNLYEKHNYVSSEDLITIIGNLIENSFEACAISSKENKIVELLLNENKESIRISVRDNGIEIPKNIKEDIFKQDVSSKGKGRGIGLALIKSRVELYNGNIDIIKEKNSKTFNIIVFKGDIK